MPIFFKDIIVDNILAHLFSYGNFVTWYTQRIIIMGVISGRKSIEEINRVLVDGDVIYYCENFSDNTI